MKASNKLFWIRFKSLISYIIYTAILLTVSYFFDRFVQMLMFVLFFNFIQNCFNYRFHADSFILDPIKAIRVCKIITIVVELIYLAICIGFNISFYSNLFVIIAFALVNCLLEYSIQNTLIKPDIFSDKERLLLLCQKARLSKTATNRMIMKYIEKKTYQEIANLEYVDVETIKKSINRSRNKILKGQV